MKYPKITALLLTYIAVFYLFSFSKEIFENILESLSYLGVFISGIFYTYSFTGSIGTAYFYILKDSYPPIILAMLGGFGGALADISILKFLEKFNFENEIDMLAQEKFFEKIKLKIFKSKIILTILGFLAIASPIPDEIGVLLIKKGKILSIKFLFLIGLFANALGIYIIASL